MGPATAQAFPEENVNLSDLIVCLACRKPVEIGANGGKCTQCHKEYPAIGGILCLMPEPEVWIAEWGYAFHFYALKIQEEIIQLQGQTRDTSLLPSTIARLEKLRTGKNNFIQLIETILQPLLIRYQQALAKNQIPVFRPPQMGPDKYYENLLRDWVWGNSENSVVADRIERILAGDRNVGNCLLLGSGGCGLACELYDRLDPSYLVLADLNPVLSLAAYQVLAGEVFNWIEFPLYPFQGANTVVISQNAPQTTFRPNIEQIFIDALNSPFKPEIFDTVISPWFIDVAGSDLRDLLPKINMSLKPGGRWINVGPLGFNKDRAAQVYSLEETQELIQSHGFELFVEACDTVSYMQSPYSSTARTDQVYLFSAVKRGPAVARPASAHRNSWLKNHSKPIPRGPALEQFTQIIRSQLDLFSQIDGKTSIENLSKKLSKQFNVPPEAIAREIESVLSQFDR